MVGATIEEGPLIRGGFLSIMVMISIQNFRISIGKSGCRKGEGGEGVVEGGKCNAKCIL